MTTTKKKAEGFTADERSAMKERAKEAQAARTGTADGEADLLGKIAEMPPPDRAIAERIHAIITANAPELAAKTWYGMPAWARDGKVVCFFQPAAKFKYRYATLGFSDQANLDEGGMWPTTWALTKLTKADEQRIAELVKRAVG